jgi:hypothetical protein
MPCEYDVIHIIDQSTPLDMLRQLGLLAQANQQVICIGPPPANLPGQLSVRQVHCPMGVVQLAGLAIGRQIDSIIAQCPANSSDTKRIFHFWSISSAGALPYMGRCDAALLSLPTAGDKRQMAALAKTYISLNLHLTVQTQASRLALLDAAWPTDYVHVLPPAVVGHEVALASRLNVRHALGVADSETLLVCPNEMVRYAGQKYALWCHAIVMQVDSHVRLLLPGGGQYVQNVRRFAQTTGYASQVMLTEDRFSLEDCLAGSDIAVLLVEQDVGLSMMAQAFASGIAIAASSTPDIAEFSAAGQLAVLAPPADPRLGSAAILKLIDDPAFARQMADRARGFALESLGVSQVSRCLGSIYAAVLG